jgi:putative addiction module antidote
MAPLSPSPRRLSRADRPFIGPILNACLAVRQIGNSLGVVLPKEILARLNVKSGDNPHLTEAPDGSMRIIAYDPGFEGQMRVARKGMRAFRNTLRELAK